MSFIPAIHTNQSKRTAYEAIEEFVHPICANFCEVKACR